MLLSFASFSQTTIFQDNFEAGAGNWTLNGGSFSLNQWVADAEYDGGIIAADTPNQPAGVTAGPNSGYLHITNVFACGFGGTCNASFDNSMASNTLAQLTSPIVTTGYSSVTLSFYYLSAGDAVNAFGTLEYSTDNTTWTPTGTSYVGVSAWTAATVTLPAFNNQATLKFRFRWFNTDLEIGDDPAFAIDEVKVTGQNAVSASLTTGTISPASWCAGTTASVTVPFTATGTFNSGNIYTAQLSDASGSFASPVSIGTLTSAASGALTISGSISGATAAGTGYRIRVVASDPATTGTDNGVNLVINALPAVSITATPANGTICAGQSASMTAGGAQSYVWTPSTGLSSTTTATVTANPTATTIYTVSGTDANGCIGTATSTITVNTLPSVSITATPADGVICTGQTASMTAGGAQTYSWAPSTGLSNTTMATVIASPAASTTYTVTGTAANGCTATAIFMITVETCAGISEHEADLFSVYPNPTSGMVSMNWKTQSGIASIEVLDQTGRFMEQVAVENNAFSLESYAAGTYFIRVTTTDGQSGMVRVSKN